MSPLNHLARARVFAELARSHQGREEESDLLIAAVYAARAFYENFYHEAKTGKIKITTEALQSLFVERVRHFKLIEYVRRQDFHRRPVSFREGVVAYHGQAVAKVTQAGSIAAMKVTADGKKLKLLKRNASIKEDHPIHVSGFTVSDPDTDTMVDIRQAVANYLEDAEVLIEAEGLGNV